MKVTIYQSINLKDRLWAIDSTCYTCRESSSFKKSKEKICSYKDSVLNRWRTARMDSQKSCLTRTIRNKIHEVRYLTMKSLGKANVHMGLVRAINKLGRTAQSLISSKILFVNLPLRSIIKRSVTNVSLMTRYIQRPQQIQGRSKSRSTSTTRIMKSWWNSQQARELLCWKMTLKVRLTAGWAKILKMNRQLFYRSISEKSRSMTSR